MKISSSREVNAGENLVNFINNASSCVKTVLSKPGCFKRNTNHRRFLQKQLRQSAQENKSTLEASQTSDAKTTKSNELTTKVEAIKREDDDPTSPKSEKEDGKDTSTSIRKNNVIQSKLYKQRTIKKKRRYNPIRKSPQPMLQPPVPLLIPSPTADYTTTDRFHHDYESTTSFIYTDLDSQQYLNHKDFYNNKTGTPPYPSPTYGSYFPTTVTTTNFPALYCRKSSTSSSYASSEDEFGFDDFLSGEDLMRSLEFGDLFIPDFSSGELAACRPTHFDNERQQIQYLAQLEALEACYQAREADLLLTALDVEY